MWGRDEQETLARLDARNAPIHRVRARIEKIFGTWKRSYGLRRMRWRGLARATAQARFTAIAYNLKGSVRPNVRVMTPSTLTPAALTASAGRVVANHRD